ncbi:LiaI-LiaF-like domain-containing protein [Bacillus suaedaesalsae]|uniref:DUF5668 domain-containing protein n=1 Tax=Bacillus suaedaesalsae TaxID=2810349 RepID=A0ABS2DJB8_9BACI|nr:DUF5668 domain-containing protein [Bacillus suaedaesalsae]MBM6617593.1 hypothetical protein [Bacillus suaedaesalsae]
MGKSNIVLGLTLILMGILFSLQSLGVIDNFWSAFWPMFLLIPGVIFHVAFFISGAKKHLAGLLVPGGILLVIGLLFVFESMTSWQFSHFTWPVYMYAVSFGLFELYIFGGRKRGLLIPVGILATVATIFLVNALLSFQLFNLWPLILIAVGIYVMTGQNRSKQG